MKSFPEGCLPGRWLYRVLFALATVDSLVIGLWAVARPADLLGFLNVPDLTAAANHDRLLLWRVLGLLGLCHALFLGIVVWRLEEAATLVLVPLVGRLLGVAVWLWALASERSRLPQTPLLLLALHDALWTPAFFWFLVAWLLQRRSEGRSP
jgi:hypothetical protein